MIKNILSFLRFLLIYTILTSLSYYAIAQEVDNKRCPTLYKRNNGNGQRITEFAPNISPVSIYYLSALTKSYQGTFTFGWEAPIVFPPVVTKIWITDELGNSSLNWSFGNNSTGSPFNPPGIPVGNEVSYNFHNNNLPTAGIITVEFSDPNDDLPICVCSYPLTNGGSTDVMLIEEQNFRVSSGSEGGLESKSLGSAVVKQIFKRYSDGNTALDYRKKESVKAYKNARTTGLELDSFIPEEESLGSEFTGYVTSPTELISITNAENVVSVDFLNQGKNLATFFATQTSGQVYEHSKYVCDRLKGAEILSIDSIEVEGYYLIRSLLKPVVGLKEYAISFSVGTKENSQDFHLQSAWLLDEYLPEETFYNFQFWSADGKVLEAMVKDVIHQFEGMGKLTQTVAKTQPGIFVSKTKRKTEDPSKVELTVWNRTFETSATIQVTAKANEVSESPLVSNLPINLEPMSVSTVEIDARDYAELAIDLLDQNSKKDYLYQSDGIWSYYIPEEGQVSSYQVNNDPNIQFGEDERPVWRNVSFSANGTDYATVYKTMEGGGVPADLSSYSYLNFKASGTGKLTIRLIKKSVEKFESHYTYSVDLNSEMNTFSLPIEGFRSSEFSESANLKDLVIVSFTAENKGIVEVNLSGIRFSNQKEITLAANQKALVYPNPFQGQTNVMFDSKFGGEMQLGVYSLDSGKLMFSQIIETKAGSNQQELVLGPAMKEGLYVLKLSSTLEMITAKLLVQ
ncbi:Por secretion system C-terminal sorting domain-containing protein [Algoriphagus ornithinivorans]|uniref:Por secretion system C-terminal sorting domain-containing protein n=1 Tax=Algoriphagus ornithinivorans TaxID=226506 RepID=A0A1I5AVR2_9BACT|nr:T9SS type A sorting domain-containing protein [Algoriphagus ornithinivorans]SFN66528.1 Por secretion system C-terminal sorting domain-containing protein [Algoriphagus ornithinivorans]